MIIFLAKRIVGLVAVLFAVSVITFIIFNVIPGGYPALRMAGRHPTKQAIANINKDWGFDQPLYKQYLAMMDHLFVKRDLISYQDQTEVLPTIARGIPRTLSLAIGAAALWLLFGIAMGVASGLNQGGWTDRVMTILAMTGISMPIFWLGAVLLYLITFKYRELPVLSWFPAGGYSPISDPVEWVRHLILPWITLSIVSIGFYARAVRNSLLETSSADYVRTATAMGLSRRRGLVRPPPRASPTPVVALFGLDFGAAVGGLGILGEPIFGLQGVGQYAQSSVAHLDLPPLMALTLYGAFFVVVFNAVVDIAYAWLDPRTRDA